jgi:hypothetical protein
MNNIKKIAKIKNFCLNKNYFTSNFKQLSTFNKITYTSFSNKNDYRKQFDAMLKENKLTDEQLAKLKENEEKQTKEELDAAKRRYEEGSDKLKEQFAKMKTGEAIKDNKEYEIEIDVEQLKKKFKSVFNFNLQKVKKTDEKTEQPKQEEIKQKEPEVNEQDKKETKEEQGQDQKQEQTEEQEKKETDTKAKKEAKPRSAFFTKLVDLWNHTFPGEQNMEHIMEKRKQQAIFTKDKIKEATPEEIEEVNIIYYID